MPILNGEPITPDEAIAKDLCPETGKPLSEIADIEAHIARVWQRFDNPEVARRVEMLRAWARDHAAPAKEQTQKEEGSK